MVKVECVVVCPIGQPSLFEGGGVAGSLQQAKRMHMHMGSISAVSYELCSLCTDLSAAAHAHVARVFMCRDVCHLCRESTFLLTGRCSQPTATQGSRSSPTSRDTTAAHGGYCLFVVLCCVV